MEFCNHVYRNTGLKICPDCGVETRETDWKLVNQQHKQWIADGKAIAQGWWSI